MIVLGRKNHLFAGSDGGGERAAAIYSLRHGSKTPTRQTRLLRDNQKHPKLVVELPSETDETLASDNQHDNVIPAAT